jgi:DeoR/GlpR family transcriptional regulator of sugar metabolism
MIAAARKVVIVADQTKFGRAALINVAPLEVADIVVSDDGLDAEYLKLLGEHGVEARLA